MGSQEQLHYEAAIYCLYMTPVAVPASDFLLVIEQRGGNVAILQKLRDEKLLSSVRGDRIRLSRKGMKLGRELREKHEAKINLI